MTPPALPSATDGLLAALIEGDPFNDHRISVTGAQAVDVTSIHDREFQRLVSLARRACVQNEAVGAVVWGESGSGKSNLLRRLHDGARRGAWREAIVVNFLELQATPDRLHRSVLNALISLLTNGLTPPWHRTPLYHLLQGLICPAIPHGRRLLPLPELERVFRSRIQEAAEAAGITKATRAAATLLERFFIGALAEKAHRPEAIMALSAVRRLSGDALDEEEARIVGLRPTDADTPLDAADALRFLALLTQVARADGKPVILCFDQIHTLTRQQILDVAGMLHSLNDHVRNVLLILSEVQEELRKLEENHTITQATWDRITANRIDMPRVPIAQARQILEARLQQFLAPFPSRDAHLAPDRLFPLGEEWFQSRTATLVDVRPRALLRIARTRWEEVQASLTRAADPHAWLNRWPASIGDSPTLPITSNRPEEERIDAVIEEAFRSRLARHLAAPHGLPPNAGNLCGLTESLLDASGIGSVERQPEDAPYDLLVQTRSPDGTEHTFGLAFVATTSATSTTGTLRGLANDPSPPDRVLLVTDERQPLAFGKSVDAKGREYHKALETQAGFQQIVLRFQEYAALEAMEGILRMAADLEIDTPDGRSRPLTRSDVIDSYRRTQRFETHPLLGTFFRPIDAGSPQGSGTCFSENGTLNSVSGAGVS